MATVAPVTYRPRSPYPVTGKRGKVKTVALNVRPRPVPADSDRDNYTPEYWRALQNYAYEKNFMARFKDEELTPNLRRPLNEARAKVEAERELSDVAREHGYKPGRMTAQQWSELADKLRSQAGDELRYTMESDREAAGNKIRGQADTWAQVGGEARLVRSGATAKQARELTQDINASTKASASAYMKEQLIKFGYDRETVERLDYQKRRRLLAEIGWGAPQAARITGVSKEERERVIYSVADNERLTARAISVNPRAGKGLETWTYYEQAALKAGREPDYLPDLSENNTPNYVLRPDPGQKAKIEAQRRARAEEIDF